MTRTVEKPIFVTARTDSAVMSAIDQLLQLSRIYIAAERCELSTLSSRMFNDGKKLGAIERGGDIQVRRCERAIRWLSDNWPATTPWPAEIERPRAAEVAQ
ncbi:MAG: hypothetical protein M5U08_13875 [Burkholderiales bacterium]|nr:hypothetical protein [Burkholderiales bacterium]